MIPSSARALAGVEVASTANPITSGVIATTVTSLRTVVTTLPFVENRQAPAHGG
ncbi:hypothetical protein GCM10022226_08800 [Sphaerisporangium flaviroseum]|uniref:Uncharacterized protein n=1 Tax=Sphaerisporangium flaviroseum TaxID=509199 RepID=A0ABP7HLQ4_9ACTN